MISGLLATFLVIAAPLPAREEGPKGPPPQVIMINVQADGAPVIPITRMRHVPVQRTVIVQEGGRNVTKTETVTVPIYETILSPIDGKEIQVYGVDGKKIDPKDLRGLIKGQTPAFQSADGKPVDPFYLRLAREGTVILVGPPPPPGQNVVVPFTAPPEKIPAPPKKVPAPPEKE